MLKIALLFPGQGTQYVGMGKPFYDQFPIAKKTFEEADQVLGWSLTKLCFEGPQEKLTQTANSQPAILAASVAAWRVFKEKFVEVGTTCRVAPTAAAGLSLGEYSALVAAEGLLLANALRVARIRGEAMEKAARQNPGTMASIIGLEKESVEEICRQSGAEVANINSPEQIVISGAKSAVEKGVLLANAKGAKHVILLEVSGPFHSKWMAPAQPAVRSALEKSSVKLPAIPVVHNVTAVPATSAQEIREYLVAQLCHSTRWVETIQWMCRKGIQHFVELGPGKVLTGLLKRIDSAAVGYHIETPEEIEEFVQKMNTGENYHVTQE